MMPGVAEGAGQRRWTLSEVLASVSVVGNPEPSFLGAVHRALTSLWQESPQVRAEDRAAFERAVKAVVANSILYATGHDGSVPAIWVELEATEGRLSARILEVGTEPYALPEAIPAYGAVVAASAGLASVPALLTEFRCEHADGVSTWVLGRRTRTRN